MSQGQGVWRGATSEALPNDPIVNRATAVHLGRKVQTSGSWSFVCRRCSRRMNSPAAR